MPANEAGLQEDPHIVYWENQSIVDYFIEVYDCDTPFPDVQTRG